MAEPHDDDMAALGEIPLLRGEEAFRLLVDAVQDYAIFLLGPDGTVLTWNRGAERIKGYTASEIIGRHFSVFYTPEEREAGRPMAVLASAAEHGRIEDVGWRVRKDGTRFWADVIITPLRDDDGQPYAYAKITRDLTERLEAEEQRLALLAEQRARSVAEEALAARDRFLSIASHELKTPIATLQLAAESLVRAHDARRLDEQRLTTGLERVTRATARLTTLVGELLDVSRLTAAESRFEPVPTDIVELTREVVARFEDDDHGPRIRVTAPAGAWAPADAGRLDQVISNLVDNALKYSPDGAPIDVEVRTEDGGVTIVVADRGIGLEEGAADRIFEPFGRADNAEHVPGMGLGLYIAQQIVQQHGGRLTATARVDGAGAVFTVWLPSEAGTDAPP